MKKISFYSAAAAIFILAIFMSGCNKENTVEPTELTDEQFIQLVINSGYSETSTDEDNLMSQEISDLDTGAVADDGSSLSPIDTLKRWGRKITGVNINYQITGNDTLKTVTVTRTISGNYIIVGYVGGVLQTITKPYKEVLNRNVVFKRIDRTPKPRNNWRVYQVSNLSGGTTEPQIGSQFEQINKIEVYKNGATTPSYTITGPDFQNQYWTTMRFGGAGVPLFGRGDQVHVKIYLNSSSSTPNDIVAFHWARNTFGFHRVPFAYEGMSGTDKVYSKTFTIYNLHKFGNFNAFFSASTHESLYDNDVTKFASTEVGIPYKIQ